MNIKKILPKIAILGLALAVVGSVGCSTGSCTTFQEPEITGVSDDGIWFYMGGARYRSDMTTKEELVPSVQIEGVTYNQLTVNDALYRGDDVYMCASYYGDEQRDDYVGSCIIKYNARTKEHAVLYSGGQELETIQFVSSDGTRFAIWGDYEICIISDGVIEDILDYSGREYFYSDSFIAYYRWAAAECEIEYKRWEDEDWCIYNAGSGSSIVDNVGDMLFIKTLDRNKALDYTCYGIDIFDMSSGQCHTLVDPEEDKSCSMIDVQTGYYVVGTIDLGISDRNPVVYKRQCQLYRLDLDCLQNSDMVDSNFVISFAQNDVDYSGDSTDYDYGGYIKFRGEDVDGNWHDVYFDKQTEQFVDESELPEYEVLAEYGDYEFYCKYNPAGFMFSYGYHALHRVNKVTGADEVVAVLYGGDVEEPYQFDLVCEY